MTEIPHTTQPQQEKRIIVISDLHMTAGRNPETGVWSPTEDFFLDDEFERFLEHYSRGPATTLVINGDLLDFLQVLEFPDEWKTDRGKGKPKNHVYDIVSKWRGGTFDYSIPLADINSKYGLRCTREATRFLAGKIVEGHEQFFRALVDFAACDGNSVVILKGNHDIQLFWQAVQDELYERMECLAPAAFRLELRQRIVFKPWFHYEKDLIWIEHGNQYEYTTSFVNFLVPTLPFTYNETASGAARQPKQLSGNNTSAPADEHIELDLSSFLVRYLTNPSEPVNPLADNIRPLTRYWEGMWREHPFFVLGTFKAGLCFVLTAFGKSARMKMKTGWSARKGSPENDECMKRESDISGIPLRDLQNIDYCKAEPTMTHGPHRVLWWFLKPAIIGAIWLAPLTIVISNITKWIPDPPDADGFIAMLERTGITLLQGAVVIAVGALLVGARKLFRKFSGVRARTKGQTARDLAVDVARSGTMEPELPWVGNAQLDMRTMATYIATKLKVPFVTFGHTHYSDIYRISDNQWYFNSGTWMTILEPREQLFREARQLTFLEVTGGTGNGPKAQLLCWYPPQSQPRPVVVVDLEELDDNVENGLVGSVAKFFGRRTG